VIAARLVAFATRHRRAMLAAAVLVAVAGELGRRRLGRDVLPDLSDPQVVLVADWMGHDATEVAASVTSVLTAALADVPGATAVRGSSMAGMAYVDVVFGSESGLPAGRRAILDRVARARPRLPPTVRIDVGPEASSTGWVFQYALYDPTHGQPPLALRRLQEDVVRPMLASIPGVVEVASVGGATEEALVEVLAAELRARGLAFSDVLAAVRPLLAARPAASLAELGALRLPAAPTAPGAPATAGEPVLVRDVARVRKAIVMPSGLSDFAGTWPAVGGIVIAKRHADLGPLIRGVRLALESVRARLPAGVRLVTVYDRLDLATRAERTLLGALAEEVAVVVLVILIFLLHPKSALLPLLTLPLVLLGTFAAMAVLGTAATIMSLAGIGIALGMAVDADVVALEACHRRLEQLPPGAPADERRRAIVAAASSVAPAILTSLVIAALSFLPVFAFSGEAGRLLRPLVLTKTLVVAVAAVVALTIAPALRALLLGGGRRQVPAEMANPLVRRLVAIYRPFVRFALDRPMLTLGTATLAVLSCLPIASRLGGEFLPQIDEGDLLYMPTTMAGATAEQAELEMRRQDQAISAFGAVATVFGKVGRADTATDPAPLSMAETTVRLLPRSQWPKLARTRWYSGWAPRPLRRALGLIWPEETPPTLAELIESLDRAAKLPGWSGGWTAPIRARMDMMATGVRTPLGIRIVAADPERLDALGAAVRAVVEDVPDTRSAVVESLGGETRLEFFTDAQALARHGVDAGAVQEVAHLVLAGGQIGDLDQAGRRLRVRILPEQSLRGVSDQIRAVTVRASRNRSGDDHPPPPVALGLLGRPKAVSRPATIRSEGGELAAYVHVDVAPGTDLRGYVQRAQAALDGDAAGKDLALAPGERIEWTGQYRLLAAGQRRLIWIVPAVVLSMLALLFLQFRSLTEALIVLASVPFALVGSIWTLFALGYQMSAPVWVGLLSTIGLAMQTGVVMVVYIDEAFHRRVREGKLASRDDIVAAHAEGTVQRLRPKLMTVTTMAAGLLPLLWADGPGAEIARRVAAPMIGGLASSAFLTLEVLPVLYTIWRHRQLRRALRLGVPIQAVIGRIPPWAR